MGLLDLDRRADEALGKAPKKEKPPGTLFIIGGICIGIIIAGVIWWLDTKGVHIDPYRDAGS